MDKRRSRSRKNRKKEKKFNWTLVAQISAIFCIIFLATFFSILNMGNSRIINNIYINGISVSSLSTEEARNKLEPLLEEQLSKEISIKFGDYETSLLPAEIDFNYDLAPALEEAYGIGRTGNILTNNFRILISLFKKTNIEAPITYNSNKLDNIIDNISVEIPDLVVQPTYYTSNGELIITKGTAGNELNKDETKKIILSAIKDEKENIDLPVNSVQPETIDLAKIHDEIYTEPKNASVTKEPYSISVEKKGVDFGISIEEAQNLLNNSESNEISIYKGNWRIRWMWY